MNEPSENLSIGLRLEQERKRLKVTQAALSQQVGVSKVMMSRYACGYSAPRAELLVKLSQLGFDILYILTGTRVQTIPIAPRIDFDRLAQALAEANRQVVVSQEVVSQRHLLERAWSIYQAWDVFGSNSPPQHQTQSS